MPEPGPVLSSPPRRSGLPGDRADRLRRCRRSPDEPTAWTRFHCAGRCRRPRAAADGERRALPGAYRAAAQGSIRRGRRGRWLDRKMQALLEHLGLSPRDLTMHRTFFMAGRNQPNGTRSWRTERIWCGLGHTLVPRREPACLVHEPAVESGTRHRSRRCGVRSRLRPLGQAPSNARRDRPTSPTQSQIMAGCLGEQPSQADAKGLVHDLSCTRHRKKASSGIGRGL
jgi:hypothetical protein